MKLVSARNQQVRDCLYRADGAIVTGGTPQLVIAQSMARSFLYLQNNSTGNLTFEIGYGSATATVTNPGQSGHISSISVVNAGFGYTYPPVVRLLGGGLPQGTAPGRSYTPPNTAYLGLNQPNGASPSNPAQAVAVLSGGSISAINVTNPGSGYVIAPYVQIMSSDLDPYGCALPSATSGFVLGPGQSLYFNGTTCPTCPVSVFGSTTGQAYVCRWMD